MKAEVRYKSCGFTRELDAISSKSYLHRALICSAFSQKGTKIIYREISDDINATIECLRNLGASIDVSENEINVLPVSKKSHAENITLNCKESGSTYRFMIPLASCFDGEYRFIGEGRLPERPVIDLVNSLKENGIEFSDTEIPFTLKGGYSSKNPVFSIRGDISSQYISGILLSAPVIGGNVKIKVMKPFESKSYVDLTVSVMKDFGVDVGESHEDDMVIYTVSGKGYKTPETLISQGDWSNSAFLLAVGALDSYVRVNNLDMNSKQGDRKIVDILKDFGSEVTVSDNSVTVSEKQFGIIFHSLSDTPDMLPVLSVLACAATGKSVFSDGARLRLKESDRLVSVRDMVENLGGRAEIKDDCLIVSGKGELDGGEVDSCNDHRIVMASSIAAMLCKDKVVIDRCEAVNKSYPDFFDDIRKLGFDIDII